MTREKTPLRLNRETVRHLSDGQLGAALGGNNITHQGNLCPLTNSIPLTYCQCTGTETRDALCQ
jgi:hypothetical protein